MMTRDPAPINDAAHASAHAPNRVTASIALFLALRFVIELGLLAAIGYWAASQGFGTWERIGLAAGAVFVAAVAWAALVSPRALVRLPENGRLTVELLFVVAAVVGLQLTGRVRPALLLGVAGVTVAVLNSLLRRDLRSRS